MKKETLEEIQRLGLRALIVFGWVCLGVLTLLLVAFVVMVCVNGLFGSYHWFVFDYGQSLSLCILTLIVAVIIMTLRTDFPDRS